MPASRQSVSSHFSSARPRMSTASSPSTTFDPDLIANVRALQQRFKDETQLSVDEPEPAMFAGHVLVKGLIKGSGSFLVPWIIENPPFPHKRTATVGCLLLVAPKPSVNIAQELGWWMIVLKITDSRVYGVWVETKADLQKVLEKKEVGNPAALRYQLDELSEKDSEVNAFMTDEKDWIDRECAIVVPTQQEVNAHLKISTKAYVKVKARRGKFPNYSFETMPVNDKKLRAEKGRWSI